MALTLATLVSLVDDLKGSIEKDDAERASDIMLRLKATPFPASVIQSAGPSCKYIATLLKHSNPKVATTVGPLIAQWKDIVKEALITKKPSVPAKSASTSTGQTLLTAAYKPLGAPVSSGKPPLEQLRDELASDPLGVGGSDVHAALGYAYADTAPACDRRRYRTLRKGRAGTPGPVIYWMSRDQRVSDNWALLRAQARALESGSPLIVVFCLLPSYAGAALRAYGFMLRGLRQVEADLAALGIPFRLLLGAPAEQVAGYANAIRASAVVADFCPLRAPMAWKREVGDALHDACELEEVDAHNVVPVWLASPKLEVGARTIRKKIHEAVHSCCGPFPRVQTHPHALPADAEAGLATYAPQGAGAASSSTAAAALSSSRVASPSAVRLAPHVQHAAASSSSSSSSSASAPGLTDWAGILPHLSMDASVPEVAWAAPGERAGRDTLLRFLTARLKKFDDLRNDPTQRGATSNLSPYLHFGQVSAQRVVLELSRASGHGLRHLFADKRESGPQAFAEELVVRRELADNYCFYQPQYDSLEGAWAWAQETLRAHAGDKRAHVYSSEQLEAGRTHEDLWNAAQMELVHSGKMHGFMRMYWAKKILEWTVSPEEALRIAIYLNDKYSLDGRDPNGYVGCIWSIAGVHDMGWQERPIFGKIRFMNYDGCKRKFSIAQYVLAHPVRPLPRPAGAAGSSSS